MRRKFSAQGLALLKSLEGYTPTAKHLRSDRATVITGGYGQTNVKLGETHPEEVWAAMLQARVRQDEMLVDTAVHVPLTQTAFDALVLFCYNVGPGSLQSSPPLAGFLTSTLLKKLNAGDYEGAANEFQRWNKVGAQICQGLTNRRAAEEKLFRQDLGSVLPKAA